MDRYILASQSPRRRELLHLVLNEYEVIPAQGEEIVRSTDPAEVVQELSLQKAMEVAKRVQPCDGDRMIVIGADTVVAVDGEILGKPEDRADASRMIGLLQGREHHVYTGVTVCCVEKAREIRHFSFSEETAVDVFPMNRGEIEGYVSLKGGRLRDPGSLQHFYPRDPRRLQQCRRSAGGPPLSRTGRA